MNELSPSVCRRYRRRLIRKELARSPLAFVIRDRRRATFSPRDKSAPSSSKENPPPKRVPCYDIPCMTTDVRTEGRERGRKGRDSNVDDAGVSRDSRGECSPFRDDGVSSSPASLPLSASPPSSRKPVPYHRRAIVRVVTDNRAGGRTPATSAAEQLRGVRRRRPTRLRASWIVTVHQES